MATVPNLRMEPPPRSLAADAQDRIMVRIEADPPNTRLRRRAPPALHGSPRIPRPASVTLDHRGEQRQPDVADEHDEPFTHGGAAPHPDAVVGVESRFKANAARSRAPPRSEERSVGKEGVRRCRSRWLQSH